MYPGLVCGVTTPSAGQTTPSMSPPGIDDSTLASIPTDQTTAREINETTPSITPSSFNESSIVTPSLNVSTPSDTQSSTTASAATGTSCNANYTATVLPVDFFSPSYPKNYRRYAYFRPLYYMYTSANTGFKHCDRLMSITHHVLSRARCGIRLYRFVSIAFSSILLPNTQFILFIAGSGSSVGSVSAWHASGPEFDPNVRHILS